jgi:hypothetical protein
LDSLPLKMGPIDCPETSARYYHYTLRNSPEELSSQIWDEIIKYKGIRGNIIEKLKTIVYNEIMEKNITKNSMDTLSQAIELVLK